MKILTILVVCFSLLGCEEENCYDTDVIDYYKEVTNYYTTTMVAVYKQECS